MGAWMCGRWRVSLCRMIGSANKWTHVVICRWIPGDSTYVIYSRWISYSDCFCVWLAVPTRFVCLLVAGSQVSLLVSENSMARLSDSSLLCIGQQSCSWRPLLWMSCDQGQSTSAWRRGWAGGLECVRTTRKNVEGRRALILFLTTRSFFCSISVWYLRLQSTEAKSVRYFQFRCQSDPNVCSLWRVPIVT